MVSPLAAAQQPTDPTVNDSDFNTTAPPPDASYLNDTNASSSPNSTTDPTVSDSDFNTSVPPDDTAYLDAAASQYGVDNASAPSASPGAARTPGPGIALVSAAAFVGALVLGGRRRSG